MKDPPQKFKISYLNSVWNFFIISNFKSSGLNSKGFMGRKIFSLTNKRVDFCQISSSVYIEGIFCKSSNQIYKPIEICNFVLCGTMKTTTVQIFTMILLTQIKLPLKESEVSRLSKCISLSWKIGKIQNMEFLGRRT